MTAPSSYILAAGIGISDPAASKKFYIDSVGLVARGEHESSVGQDHELVVNGGYEIGQVTRDGRTRNFFRLPVAADTVQLGDYESQTRQTEVKIDYTRPMPKDGKLKAGYALQYDANSYENLGRRGFAIGSDRGAATYGERVVAVGGYADRRW